MSYALRERASVARLVARFGDGATVVVRRPHSLVKSTTGGEVTALAAQGAQSSGASTLTLDSGQAWAVRGTLEKGCKLTSDSDATVYEVTAAAAAAAGVLTVSITPVLAQNEADNATFTISQAYGEWTVPAARRAFRSEDIDGENVLREDYLLLLSVTDATAMPDLKSKDLVLFDGERQNVLAALPFSPGNTAAAVRLHVGER